MKYSIITTKELATIQCEAYIVNEYGVRFWQKDIQVEGFIRHQYVVAVIINAVGQ